ncbi:hypothetical protein WKI71_18265 [Streptomyces sp. MS1.AVA.1]|uniref:Uncharacterized protein n=1 Tax=Streptomyces machairae TaxID=3134109 RepID=A0ABU8ULD5_9ACTN
MIWVRGAGDGAVVGVGVGDADCAVARCDTDGVDRTGGRVVVAVRLGTVAW